MVELLTAFRHKQICLVFEYVDKTVLEHIDASPEGLPEETVRLIMYQLLSACAFMH